MTDSTTLLTQAKCYLCLGVTLEEALQLALLAQIASGASAAKVYRALMTQSGTNPPTALVLENSLGFDVTYTYVGVGGYQTVQLFDPSKTFAIVNGGAGNQGFDAGIFCSVRRINGVTPVQLFLQTYNWKTQASVDGQLQNTPFEILVYP